MCMPVWWTVPLFSLAADHQAPDSGAGIDTHSAMRTCPPPPPPARQRAGARVATVYSFLVTITITITITNMASPART